MLFCARELVALCLGRRTLARVTGASMAPTLEDGAVIAVRRNRGGLPAPGQVVVVTDPRDGRRLVKRCSSVAADTFAVASDNPHGAIDSRSFGSLSRPDFVGVALWSWSLRGGLRDLRRTS